MNADELCRAYDMAFEAHKPCHGAALLAIQAAVRRECAELCRTLPVDRARCRILLLTEQAWEEAQEQCCLAIEAMA